MNIKVVGDVVAVNREQRTFTKEGQAPKRYESVAIPCLNVSPDVGVFHATPAFEVSVGPEVVAGARVEFTLTEYTREKGIECVRFSSVRVLPKGK